MSQPYAVHRTWHVNVCKHDLNVRAIVENSDRFVGICCRYGYKAGIFYDPYCMHPYEGFVLNYQYNRFGLQGCHRILKRGMPISNLRGDLWFHPAVKDTLGSFGIEKETKHFPGGIWAARVRVCAL